MREILLKDYLIEKKFDFTDFDKKAEFIKVGLEGNRAVWESVNDGGLISKFFKKTKKLDIVTNLRDDRGYKIKFNSSLRRAEFLGLIEFNYEQFEFDEWLSFIHRREKNIKNTSFFLRGGMMGQETISYIALTFINEIYLKLNNTTI